MTDATKRDLLNETAGLDEMLGITYEKREAKEVIASMPVTPRHLQPFGYLHGGASVVLAESVASLGATLNAPPGKAAFGMEINANHLRPKKEGRLRAIGHPVFTGKSSQVWEVRIYDERGHLICISRCTLVVR